MKSSAHIGQVDRSLGKQEAIQGHNFNFTYHALLPLKLIQASREAAVEKPLRIMGSPAAVANAKQLVTALLAEERKGRQRYIATIVEEHGVL